jgi:hypothetical protein
MNNMTVEKVRNWLGIFFLGTTALVGAYIILFQETRALPINAKDAMSAFQILIPTLIAQVTIVFKWIASPPSAPEAPISLPSWAVIGPPVLVIVILVTTVIVVVGDQGDSLAGGPIFKNAVTFAVSLLNASTVFIVTRVFQEASSKRRPQQQAV